MRSRCRIPPAARAAAALAGALVAMHAAPAQAEPQATVGLTLGVAGAGLSRSIWQSTAFHLGVHGDVLFGRSSNADFGIGPYAEVLTNGFDEIQFGGGLSGLLPVLDTYPIVVSVGAYGRQAATAAYRPLAPASFGLEAGLAGELFFGSRSYNFHAPYVMTAGLIAQMRYGLGPSKETSIVLGAQVDFAILSLPFVFLFNAARGGSSETESIR